MHDLARLAGFNDEGHLSARFFTNQVVMHGGEREQAGDGGVVPIDAAVGENQQRVSGLDGQRGAAAQLIEPALQAARAFFHGEQHGQGIGQKIAARDAAQLFQVGVGQNGMGQLERMAVLRRLIENIALGADVTDQRHHHLFADGVDGRIGHLREKLLEIIE